MKCLWCEFEGEPGDVSIHWRLDHSISVERILEIMKERGYIDGWNDAEKERQALMDSRQSEVTK